MASINWLKLTKQRLGSLNVHLDNNERKSHNHSNKDIDKKRTIDNTTIGCDNFKEVIEKVKNRTNEVDKIKPPKRKKKDRIIAVSLEFTCPLEIQQMGKDEEFFEFAYERLKYYFGEDNIHGMFIHRDEQHIYTDDNGDKKISLYHAHCICSPYTDEYGINGKHFETRERLTKLNEFFNQEVLFEYNMEYNTHHVSKQMKVEELKARENYNKRMADYKLAELVYETKTRAEEQAIDEFNIIHSKTKKRDRNR